MSTNTHITTNNWYPGSRTGSPISTVLNSLFECVQTWGLIPLRWRNRPDLLYWIVSNRSKNKYIADYFAQTRASFFIPMPSTLESKSSSISPPVRALSQKFSWYLKPLNSSKTGKLHHQPAFQVPKRKRRRDKYRKPA